MPDFNEIFHRSYKNIKLAGYLLGLSFISIPGYIFSQDNKAVEDFYYGEYYLNEEKYENALPFYLKLADSLNAFIDYRVGQCYFNIREQRQEAIPYLEKASKRIASGRDKAGFETGLASLETFYLLGEAYQRVGRIDDAFNAYLNYKENISTTDIAALEKVNFKIQSIAFAKNLMSEPVELSETNLGPVINTRFSDYNPVITLDEKILVYTSFWESADLIFISTYENGYWSKPVDITSQLGSDRTFYTSSISPDAKELYLIKQSEFNCDIYVSFFKNNAWGNAVKLNSKINSYRHETSVSVTADGKYMYFTSDRPGGFGGFDIYLSEKVNGDWDKPVNLGKLINTSLDEEAPYITPDGKNLFFSSEGHKNIGGMDIFESCKMEDGSWSQPENMGFPVNTTEDDLSFNPIKDGKVSYYSKYDPAGSGRNDIFRIEFKDDVRKNHDHFEKDRNELLSDAISDTVSIHKNDTGLYAIQIIALKNPISTKYFKEFKSIKVKQGSDDFYHYLVGEFKTVAEAENYLIEVRGLGYSDAFIKNLLNLKNKEVYE